ncbi:MAG TPA: hypothetical protein VKT52_03085 [Ktedonobacterales bacterium]|nr:hypothetical protein [Ktedonobacterales bacterium]
MAHQVSLMLTDEEYAELQTEAEKSGKPVEAVVHDMLAQRLRAASEPARAMTSREFTERQYREGKVLNLPTREPLTAHEAGERERRARLLMGGTSASEMLIEDRGPR